MTKPHLVIIGSGMASGRLLEELMKRAPDSYEISVVGAEPYGNYNRIMLSPVLAGDLSADEIMLNSPEWYAQNGITFIAGDPVLTINTEQQTVSTRNGQQIGFDKLVIATGSNPVIPSAADSSDLQGLHQFRNLDDVDRILKRASTARHALVIGGGLLGLEAAYGLRQKGLEVTVVHRGKWLLNRQLDSSAADLLKQTLENRGIEIRLNCEVERFCGEYSVSGDSGSKVPEGSRSLSQATLTDGSVVQAELAVIAIGITPEKTLAQTSGIDCERGILVNDQMQSTHPNIFALGECVQFGRETFGLVAPIWDQARVLADQLSGQPGPGYEVQPCATKLKVSGIDLFSAGDFMGREHSETLVYKDLQQGIYKKLIFQDQLLIGVVLYGAVQDGNWYFDLIQQKTEVRQYGADLIFGQRFINDPEPAEETITVVAAPASKVTANPTFDTPGVTL